MLNNKLAKAVRLAIAFGGASTAVFAANANAAEEQAAEAVERIEVTGSRIKRTDMEGATPVQVIDAQSILDSGELTVADVLRSSTQNSFGSFSERSGSSAQSNASISLRGLGSDRTLVLLDGQRIPGSPALSGASANLNMLPMAAVERIEMMTDGGSAIYGSDAVAGVINIILKKDFEGLKLNYGVGRPSQDGGDEDKWSIVGGLSNDKGNVTFSIEHQARDAVFDADRWYTAPRMEDLNGDGKITMYEETEGVSYYGATIKNPGEGLPNVASPLCDDLTANVPGFVGVFELPSYIRGGGEGCGFAYGGLSANRASLERDSLFINANYEVADDLIANVRASMINNKSFGRYAPPAATYPSIAADNPNNPYDEATTGYFRWYQLGNRNSTFNDLNKDLLVSLNGEITADIMFDVTYHYNNQTTKDVGNTYLSYAGLDYNINNDIALDSDAGIANMSATTLTELETDYQKISAGLSFNDLFELNGGGVGMYVGAEYFEIDYKALADKQAAAGLVGGGAGGDSVGERDVFAAFAEVVLPVTDAIEVNAAVRYDDYSDAGSAVSPKVSVRYQITDDIVARASWGKGFRAPNMDELYGLPSDSAEFATDYYGCSLDPSCSSASEAQYDTTYYSNEDLDPETSTSINVGVAWNITDDLSMTFDYYDIEIKDVIDTVDVQSMIFSELNGLDLDTLPGNVTLERDASNAINEATAGYENLDSFSTTGVDFNLNYKTEFSFGEVGFDWANTYVIAFDEAAYFGGPVQNKASWSYKPDYKTNTNFFWTNGDHRVTYGFEYTSSTANNETANLEKGDGSLKTEGSMDSWLIHNISYTYTNDMFGAITLGARNFTDEDPVLDDDNKWSRDAMSLYNNLGRVYYMNYTISF